MAKVVKAKKAAPRGTKAAGAKAKSKAVKPVLIDSPGHLLRRAEQRASSIYTQEVGLSGLTPRQYVVLSAVAAYEGQTQTDLVAATGIDRSTLADMVARMITGGLLHRERTKGDARANAVSLSAAGKRQLAATAAKVRAAEKRVIAPVAVAKRAVLLECLRALGAYKDDAKSKGARG